MAIALQSALLERMVEFKGKKFFEHRSLISHHATRQHKTCVIAMQNRKNYNFYEVLSLDSSKNVGLEEIKKAYRSKALEFHPDVCPPSAREESTRRFLKIKMAHETLSDPISRENYDDELRLSLVDGEGRKRHGMSPRVDKGTGDNHGFRTEVWQRQLIGLKKRSLERMGKKSSAE